MRSSGHGSRAPCSRGSGTRRTCNRQSRGSWPHHAFSLDGRIDALYARRFLAEHGDELASDLIAHKHADLNAKPVPADRAGRRSRSSRDWSRRSASQPHRDRRPRGHGRRPARDRIHRRPAGGAGARSPARRRRHRPRSERPGLAPRSRARGARMNAATIAEAYEAICAEVGPGVTVVAATKYVAAERDGGARRGGHRGRRREPRAGHAAEARAARRPVPLALHRRAAVEQGAHRRLRSASSCMRSRRTPRRDGSRSPRCSR